MARPAVFINPDLNTPEDIARAQALLGAIAPNYGKAANVGEGIAQLMIGVGTGVKNRKLAKAETAGRAQGNSAFEKIMGAMSGANTQFPAAPSMGGEQQAVSAPSATGVDVAKRLQADFNLTPEAAAGFAGNLAHESGNFKTLQEINPTVKGSRGGFGWAQWTGPRRRQFEAFAAANKLDPTSPEANYGFLKSELQGPEGRVLKALQGVSDPNKAAQIVSDTFLRPGIPHMGSRMSKAQAIMQAMQGASPMSNSMLDKKRATPYAGNPNDMLSALPAKAFTGDPNSMLQNAIARPASPVDVASLDPSVGMPQQMYVGQVNPNGSIGTVAQKPGIQAIAAAMGNSAPNGMAEPQQAPQQMAQAAPSDIPPMPQNEASSLDRIIGMNTPLGAPQPQGLDVGMLMQAAQNPWLTDTQKTMVNTLLQQEIQKQDPAYQMQQQAAQLGLQKDQLQLEQMRDPSKVPMTPMQQLQMQKAQLELQQAQNPGPNLKEIGGRLVQINPDGTATEVYAPPPEPIKEPAKPAEIQEYEYAKGQGFPGTFQDWKSSQKGGMALQVDPATGAVTFQQGGNIKPMTEAQSKDTVYAVRAEGSLPLLDDLAGELTGVQGNTLGQLPIVGNAMKPEKFQQAEQAANEFLQAILRKDTGAAITEGEQALYGNTYIPRFGDGAKVIQQKKEARYRALQAMKAGMTPQAILAQEKALQNSGNTPMAPLGTPAPAATPNAPKRLKFNPATGELE